MRPPPIMVACEGSGTKPSHALCPMCGIPLSMLRLVDGLIPAHKREDILAEISRGDFG